MFLLDPPTCFVAVSATRPRPDRLEDRVIDRVKDGFA
jgi:hypothetical protein